MIPSGWFRVEAAGGKSFQPCLFEPVPIPDVPGAGDHGRYPIIAMGVRCDPRMRGHAKHDRIQTCLIRITFKHDRFNSAHTGTSGTWITLKWERVFGGSKTLFAVVAAPTLSGRKFRGIEEITNQAHGICGA